MTPFKAYDIRGIYPTEIDNVFATQLSQWIWQYMNDQWHSTLLIWADVRHPNTGLIDAFVSGIASYCHTHQYHISIVYANLPVTSIDAHEYPYGVASTSVCYRAGQGRYDLGIVFTASHNPAEYVGMKCFDREVTLISTDILQQYYNKADTTINHTASSPRPHCEDMPVSTLDWLSDMLSTKFKQLDKYHQFAVDYSNGAAVSFEQQFLRQLQDTGHRIEHLNALADGSFAAHHTDTNDPHAYMWLIQTVKVSGSEFGIMFDGDADRIGFVDTHGNIIGGDIITTIIAKQLLTTSSSTAIPSHKEKILYDLTSSRIVPDTIKKYGGNPIMTRVGRFFINQELNEQEWIFAGEVSGHFLFWEVGWYELPLLALYYVMKELEEYNSFGDMIAHYAKYYRGPITNIIIQDKAWAITKIKSHYAGQISSEIDGVSVDAGSYRFNVRQSNTEPKLRITCETTTQAKRQQAMQEIQQIIQ